MSSVGRPNWAIRHLNTLKQKKLILGADEFVDQSDTTRPEWVEWTKDAEAALSVESRKLRDYGKLLYDEWLEVEEPKRRAEEERRRAENKEYQEWVRQQAEEERRKAEAEAQRVFEMHRAWWKVKHNRMLTKQRLAFEKAEAAQRDIDRADMEAAHTYSVAREADEKAARDFAAYLKATNDAQTAMLATLDREHAEELAACDERERLRKLAEEEAARLAEEAKRKAKEDAKREREQARLRAFERLERMMMDEEDKLGREIRVEERWQETLAKRRREKEEKARRKREEAERVVREKAEAEARKEAARQAKIEAQQRAVKEAEDARFSGVRAEFNRMMTASTDRQRQLDTAVQQDDGGVVELDLDAWCSSLMSPVRTTSRRRGPSSAIATFSLMSPVATTSTPASSSRRRTTHSASSTDKWTVTRGRKVIPKTPPTL